MARSRGTLSSGLRLGVALSIVLIAVIGISQLGLLPGLPNPFETDDVDRNRPVLLERLEDESEYTAARGNFEVTVDSEKDAKYLPSFIKGERTVLVAAGDVEAVVDLDGVNDGAIVVNDDDSVTVTLPEPRLTEARLDNSQTEVIDRDRGLLDRAGDFFGGDPVNDQDMYVAAEDKLEAAAADSELLDRAEENTAKMVKGLVQDLGYTDVDVVFEPPADAVA